jgi:hypothetical protein
MKLPMGPHVPWATPSLSTLHPQSVGPDPHYQITHLLMKHLGVTSHGWSDIIWFEQPLRPNTHT